MLFYFILRVKLPRFYNLLSRSDGGDADPLSCETQYSVFLIPKSIALHFSDWDESILMCLCMCFLRQMQSLKRFPRVHAEDF